MEDDFEHIGDQVADSDTIIYDHLQQLIRDMDAKLILSSDVGGRSSMALGSHPQAP